MVKVSIDSNSKITNRGRQLQQFQPMEGASAPQVPISPASGLKKGFPRVGSALLITNNGMVLLGRRNKEPMRGKWVLPGGAVQPFESIKEAAKRELREETGLEAEVGEPIGLYELILPPDEHRVIVFNSGKIVGGNPRPGSDISEVRFFSKVELRNVEISDLVKRVLRDQGLIDSDRFANLYRKAKVSEAK